VYIKNIMSQKVELFGIKFDKLTIEEVKQFVEDFIKSGQKGYIVTPNAYHVVLLKKDNEFRQVYNHATLVLADGIPIVWVSKILMYGLKRITGSDILYCLCNLAAEKGFKVYFLGSKDIVVKKVIEKLQNVFPYLKIVGFHHGYFEDDKPVIDEINSVQPEILFVGMGCPKQEKWVYNYLSHLNIKIAVLVGGVFEVIAGTKKRAPRWIQNIGLEWFWRLIQEPKRLWKRYLIGNTIFIFLVIEELIKKFLRRNK